MTEALWNFPDPREKRDCYLYKTTGARLRDGQVCDHFPCVHTPCHDLDCFVAMAISPCGKRVGLFKKSTFWVFNTSDCLRLSLPLTQPHLGFTGVFGTDGKYRYTVERTRLSQDHRLGRNIVIRCAAICDAFTAVSIRGYILIFKNSWCVPMSLFPCRTYLNFV